MNSVIIAAHNEGLRIGDCLRQLLRDAQPGELEVVVAANGCTDDTVERACEVPGVTVLDLDIAGKAAAINAAERVARGFPRAYLDADMGVSLHVLRALFAALDDIVLASYPVRRIDTRRRPIAVRSYYAINNRLPAASNGMYGRGLMVVSAAGRARFERFPEMVADDLFLDSQFTPEEKRLVESVHTTVAAPHTTKELLARLARVRRGNVDLRVAASTGVVNGTVRSPRHWSWLTDVVLPRPWLAPAGMIYAVIVAVAEGRAALGRGSDWHPTASGSGPPEES